MFQAGMGRRGDYHISNAGRGQRRPTGSLCGVGRAFRVSAPRQTLSRPAVTFTECRGHPGDRPIFHRSITRTSRVLPGPRLSTHILLRGVLGPTRLTRTIFLLARWLVSLPCTWLGYAVRGVVRFAVALRTLRRSSSTLVAQASNLAIHFCVDKFVSGKSLVWRHDAISCMRRATGARKRTGG